MEENKLNIDKIVSKINKETTAEELVKEGVPEETAQLLVKVYEKGVGEYRWKHYTLNEKHRDVCVKVCEKLL
jgi:hypothetical protein